MRKLDRKKSHNGVRGEPSSLQTYGFTEGILWFQEKHFSHKNLQKILKRSQNEPPDGAQIDPKSNEKALSGHLRSIWSHLGPTLGPAGSSPTRLDLILTPEGVPGGRKHVFERFPFHLAQV